MGLIIKLGVPVVSADGKSITLTDTTGVYNATTNPTGYNPVSIDSTNVLSVKITLPGVSGDAVEYTATTTPTAVQVIQGLPITVTASQFGLDRFPDSALKFNYQVVGSGGLGMTYVQGSQDVMGINTAGVIALVQRIAESGGIATLISVPSTFQYYALDPSWIYTAGAFDVVIAEQFPYSSAAYITAPAAVATVYANVQAEGEECLASAIGDLAINLTTTSCNSAKEQEVLMRRYMYSLISQTKYDCGDFATADRINRYLAAFCGTPSNCGCS